MLISQIFIPFYSYLASSFFFHFKFVLALDLMSISPYMHGIHFDETSNWLDGSLLVSCGKAKQFVINLIIT